MCLVMRKSALLIVDCFVLNVFQVDFLLNAIINKVLARLVTTNL